MKLSSKQKMSICIIIFLIINGCTNNTKILRDAKNGDAKAQYELGFRYETGMEVSQSIEQAKYWYELSAQQGNTWAKDNLNKINHKNDISNNIDKSVNNYVESENKSLSNEGSYSRVLLEARYTILPATVAIINEDGTINELQGEWSSKHPAFKYIEYDIGKYLHEGDNLVMLSCVNDNKNYVSYNSESTKDSDKWKLDCIFSLTGDDNLLVKESKEFIIDKIGILYAKNFNIFKKYGKYELRDISRKQVTMANTHINNFNAHLIKSQEHITGFSKKEVNEGVINLMNDIFEATEIPNNPNDCQPKYMGPSIGTVNWNSRKWTRC